MFDVGLSNSQVDQFLAYLSEIIRWNKITNITSITEPRLIVIKHFIDSIVALGATKFSYGNLVCDIGSGAGLPGIPIKIVRPDLKVVLVETNKKKCSFLTSVIGQLRLESISVFQGSIEQYAKKSPLAAVDIALLRALRLDEVKRHLLRVLNSKGKIVLYRTPNSKRIEELTDFIIESEAAYSLPEQCGDRLLTVIKSTSSESIS